MDHGQDREAGRQGTSPPPLGASPFELDRLLDELAEHLHEVRSSRDRFRGLLQAVVAVASDISTEGVLRHIVEVACDLVDARYGALGVVGDGVLQQLVTVGISDEEAARIGTLPVGKGVVGALIRRQLPLRLDDLAKSPESSGFPPNHPPMRTFLGVPVKVRDEMFGNLYLTEKRHGERFTQEDEDLVVALAAAAGVAIENSRLLQSSERQRRWAEAGAGLTTTALAGASVSEIRRLAVRQAASLAGADETGLRVLNARGEALVLVAGVGSRTEELFDRELSLDSPLGRAFDRGEPFRTVRLAGEPGGEELSSLLGVSPLMAAPLRSGDHVMGVLSLSRYDGGAPFDPEELEPVVEFGTHVALALEYAASAEARERLLLLEERDRIARDLHDVVIQRLFATGMTLEAVGGMTDPGVKERIDTAVDELDETIRDIRSTIFALQHSATGPGLRAELVDIANRSAVGLGFSPRLHFHGEIDTRVSTDLADDVRAVVNEALSNAARHAGASSVDVTLEVDDDGLRLEVTDDGVGLPQPLGRRSGLRNLAERAEAHGGSFEVRPGEAGGTDLVWAVPATLSR